MIGDHQNWRTVRSPARILPERSGWRLPTEPTPHADRGRIEQIGALWDLGDLDVRLEMAPPVLGEHTVEVLTQVGMDRASAGGLLAGGVALQAADAGTGTGTGTGTGARARAVRDSRGEVTT